jgi:hypothetical protein
VGVTEAELEACRVHLQIIRMTTTPISLPGTSLWSIVYPCTTLAGKRSRKFLKATFREWQHDLAMGNLLLDIEKQTSDEHRVCLLLARFGWITSGVSFILSLPKLVKSTYSVDGSRSIALLTMPHSVIAKTSHCLESGRTPSLRGMNGPMVRT